MNQKLCKRLKKLAGLSALNDIDYVPERLYNSLPRARIVYDVEGQPKVIRSKQRLNSIDSIRGRYRALKSAHSKGLLRRAVVSL